MKGLLVVFLSQSPKKSHRKWGIFILAFVYTMGWIMGINTYWIKKP